MTIRINPVSVRFGAARLEAVKDEKLFVVDYFPSLVFEYLGHKYLDPYEDGQGKVSLAVRAYKQTKVDNEYVLTKASFPKVIVPEDVPGLLDNIDILEDKGVIKKIKKFWQDMFSLEKTVHQIDMKKRRVRLYADGYELPRKTFDQTI